uniref:G-patch domain-containing protein n=1 Tax=Anopheles maculatus TaxID=74869 RepID=A0A182SJC1_9DIPT
MGGASTPSSIPAGPQLPVPNGVDGRKYPTPDTSLYQYDETSGFYYDPTTGLYYDANSQYYYNSETSSYLYWDPENQTYVAAPASSTTSSSTAAVAGPQQLQASNSESVTAASMTESAEKMEKSKSKDPAPPQDKVKVAKKIVKDMERWAKQLNQKKDYSVIQPPARIEEATLYSSIGPSKPLSESLGGLGSAGYADVGFSLLEKKERAGGAAAGTTAMMGGGLGASSGSAYPSSGAAGVSKAPSATSAYGGGSDSDNEFGDGDGPTDRDLVDFDRLTCLLCKRAFQSQEILMKHIKMSSLHKENLQKLNANFRASGGSRGGGGGGSSDGGSGGPYNGLQYRDRAKERRAKYGEDEAPPVNRSKERFQREIEKQTQSSSAFPQGTASAVPIGQNNIGNKLLQKMGWSEGQGLGRSNQGRVNIIEAEARVANVGLGIKAAAQFGRTTDDYKTYIKKMMKSRYEQVDVKD